MPLHQDDSYYSDCVPASFNEIWDADNSLGVISLESIGYTPHGERLSHPRGAWLLGSSPEPAEVFLSHFRSHSYQFRGASFGVHLANSIKVPWHISSFQDTEGVLRVASFWSFAQPPASN
jgi:hypothetical protein